VGWPIFSSFCYQFTGKKRDSESGLDNFGVRYFGSSIGLQASAFRTQFSGSTSNAGFQVKL
jgi:hypothetical protein